MGFATLPVRGARGVSSRAPMLPSVLFVASECAPFAKAGGLGDVVGALPIALAARGHDVRVVLPKYDTLKPASMWRRPEPLAVPLGAGVAWCAVWESRLPGSDVPIYFLEHDALFARGYLYDPPRGFAADNMVRFAMLSRGAFELARLLDFTPDVFHAHDWPSALVPVYANTVERGTPLGRAATVLTIHNLAHQGIFPEFDLWRTHVPREYFRSDGLEDHGNVNLLKGGLYHATMLTTVSPRYAEEIRGTEHGAGLDSILRFRGADLVGVLNGIDTRTWDPATDPHLPAHYDVGDLAGKAACKRALQEELGLTVRDDVPLLGVVSRLGPQKGTDVIAAAVPELLDLGAQLVVLGSGDARTEETLRSYSAQSAGGFRARIGFDEGLAHRIEAAADLFLMPSRFEPCGLNQMYSMRYGTLPIVRATGGLDDTVAQCDVRTGDGTGFKLHDLDVRALVETTRWAISVWRDQPAHFRTMQDRAMRQDFGWERAAQRYGEVYRWALERRRGA
jgi:starch synthase